MRTIWAAIYRVTLSVGAFIAGVAAYVTFGGSYQNAALVCALASIVLCLLAVRGPKTRHAKRRQPNQFDLDEWKSAESRDVMRPRDPRTKYCVENIGREIVILYRGNRLTVRPKRVYTKPKYKKTYVDAIKNGELRTFDIDDIKLP